MEQIILDAFREAGLIQKDKDKFVVVKDDGQEIDVLAVVKKIMEDNPLTVVTNNIKSFCEMGGQEVAPKPRIWSEEMRAFRMRLIIEETEELADASEAFDEIEERDAIMDSIYVLVGYSLQRGIHSSINKDWIEVHNSNMSKFDTNVEDARATVAYWKRQVVDCEYFDRGDGVFVVKRKEDGKVLKSHKYTKVNFKKII